jgi:hypothetical protein
LDNRVHPATKRQMFYVEADALVSIAHVATTTNSTLSHG